MKHAILDELYQRLTETTCRANVRTELYQPDGVVEPENKASVLQLKEQADAKDNNFYYELDADYEPEGSDTSNKLVTQKKKRSLTPRMRKWSSPAKHM